VDGAFAQWNKNSFLFLFAALPGNEECGVMSAWGCLLEMLDFLHPL